MSCERIQPQISWYLYNELDEQERTEVEEHLETCAACAAELQRERAFLARFDVRQRVEPSPALLAEFLPQQLALGMGFGAPVLDGIEQVARAVAGFHNDRLLAPDIAPPQMIEAQVRHDPVEPGVKAAFEAESPEIPVGLE